MKGLQLPLGVRLTDSASFANYHAGPNAEAVAALRRLLGDEAPPRLLIFGAANSGKTHLLQALVQEAALQRRTCAYIPLRQLAGDGVDAIEGLDQTGLVCIDDVDAVLGEAGWCLGLLRFLDTLHAHGGRCALSAAAPAERLAIALPDLATRLTAATTYGLRPLDDPDRIALLKNRAHARGLELPPDAARLLVTRLPRDVGSLLGALERLDQAALTAQRRITAPFIQQWLRETPPT
jgi:DnaA-homolog protein